MFQWEKKNQPLWMSFSKMPLFCLILWSIGLPDGFPVYTHQPGMSMYIKISSIQPTWTSSARTRINLPKFKAQNFHRNEGRTYQINTILFNLFLFLLRSVFRWHRQGPITSSTVNAKWTPARTWCFVVSAIARLWRTCGVSWFKVANCEIFPQIWGFIWSFFLCKSRGIGNGCHSSMILAEHWCSRTCR